MWELWFKKYFIFKSNNIVNKVMLWLKRLLRWIFDSLIICFVLIFRDRNRYLEKIGKKLGKYYQKFNATSSF